MKIGKVLGWSACLAAGVMAAFAAAAAIFLRTSPQFGNRSSPERLHAYSHSDNYRDGRFVNPIPTPMNDRIDKLVPMMFRYFFTEVPDKIPDSPLPMDKVDPALVADRDTAIARVTWFGHSACLLEVDGRKILFDPMFGQAPAPLSFLASKRFNPELPIEVERLPRIDAVLISHDHYDHLDYGSILRLKGMVDRFYVPLGVGAHLAGWGVDTARIVEMNWGDSSGFGGIGIFCSPARHFSGRGLGDRFETLWASWVVKSRRKRIYFSGDTGYGPHFRAIGEAHGPFDFAMMECGQYNEQWPDIHMMAGETVKASMQLRAATVLPIHWGAFALSLHSWYDPIRAITAAARGKGLRIAAPKIGEPVPLEGPVPSDRWWP